MTDYESGNEYKTFVKNHGEIWQGKVNMFNRANNHSLSCTSGNMKSQEDVIIWIRDKIDEFEYNYRLAQEAKWMEIEI